MADPHNRLRQLKGLITIDAWHEKAEGRSRVDLFAYVNFDSARLGGEGGDEIAFRMSLRSAEIKLLQSEPKTYSIDPGLIWRGDCDQTRRLKRTIESGDSLSKTGEIGVRGGVKSAITGLFRRQSTRNRHEKLEYTSDEPPKAISVTFERTSRDQPVWVLRPAPHAPRIEKKHILFGQPWNERAEPLLSLAPDKIAEQRELLSSLRLCVICKREDIIFHDISVRSRGGQFVDVPMTEPKRLIVQEYLKSSLISEGLPVGDMNSPFSIITLGEVISEQRRPGDE